MEGSSWRPAPGGQGEPTAVEGGSGDWRSQLQPDSRQRIVNKIMETLKRHLPISVPEGINELKKIAVRFEEKIYTAASNQSDYLRKISLKMLSMETKTQGNAANNPSPSNPALVNQNSVDSASLGMQPQVSTQGQTLAMPLVNQSQVRQPLLPQNLQTNSVSAGLPSGLSSLAGINQSTIANVGQASNLQNLSGALQNSVSNSAGQGAPQNIYANSQRQIQGRQQQSQMMSQQQQQQSQLYQQQIHQQLLKQKIQHSSIMQPHMQQQQQQQSLLQSNQLLSSQQSLLQMPSSMQTGQSAIQHSQPSMMHSAQQTNLQQNQQNPIQQSMPSLMQQHSQSIGRQQQGQPTMQQQSTSLQQQSTPIPQQPVLLSQQQLMTQPSNMANMQQNHLLGQQNNVVDIHQQQQQFQQPQRLPGQQNNLISMQQPQQILNQQTMSLNQQQQLGSQNNISGQQQQQQHQQQQLQSLGPQSSVSTMQQQQRSMHILQQTKTITQQQNQQPPLTVLQSQNQSSQQQLMSQIQSQTPQLQQQLAMQQQSNSMQREMQQRLQASGPMLQAQNTIEQQKQFIQSQRGLPEVSSSPSVESTPQTGHTGAVDWQEEIYQKITAMKESYFAELSEINQKITLKFQQHESLIPPAKQSEQFEKLKSFKAMLERAMGLLQLNKNNLHLSMKEKLPQYEKQIMHFIASNRSKKVAPSQQQGPQQFQHPSGHSHSIAQQHPSQVPQLQQHENFVTQAQQINLQGSVASLQSAPASSMQHGSIPLSTQATVPTIQTNMANILQPASNLDQIQGSSFNSLQQGAMGTLQQGGAGSLQNTINGPQQSNLNTMSPNSVNTLQSNISPLPSGSNVLQQHLKQHQQEQQLIQNQQIKQQLQQRHMQQIMQQQQKQQILQQPQMQQQLHQHKQQQAGQMPVHQLQQLHQMNDLKVRQNSGIKSGTYQQHYSAGQRHNYYQQTKTGSSFPNSSPQNLQATSPQISQHSSPQIDHNNLLSSHSKAGTPLQNASSPFVVPSPSTPIAPFPIPGDSEKLSVVTTVTSGVNVGHQQTSLAPPQAQSLAVGTPGISASPLLAEFTSPDGSQINMSSTLPGKSSATEQPLKRLIKAVESLSTKALCSSISDIGSVVSMIDRIAGSAPGNGSRAAVGEDLVAMTKCRLQARNFLSQDGSATMKKMKRHTSAMPLNVVSSAGSVNDSFKQSYGLDTSELESTATSSIKRQKVQVSHALLEEIREINQKLIDTVVSITNENTDSIVAASEDEGTVVVFSFSAVSLSPNLKSQFASSQMSPITPLRLLVPTSYPKCSPELIDMLPVEGSKEFEDLSVKAQSMFSISLRCLSQPMSLEEMARTWDTSARKVIVEYAQRSGGGSFSSRYGSWENCVSA